ncbi:MAG: hypothetical protein WA949_00665 [Phormidesmis sp.]
MARQKKASTNILAKAQSRLLGMKSVDPKLDLGNGLTAAYFEKEILTMQQKLGAYHTLLAQADEISNELEVIDKHVSRLTSRVLAGVGAQYGRDSSEYEMVGGVRLGDRRRRKKQSGTADV